VRVTLGGERRVDVGQALGYKDGSAITHILKRLQARAAIDRGLRTELAKIQKAFACHVSRVDPEYGDSQKFRGPSRVMFQELTPNTWAPNSLGKRRGGRNSFG
jgi:hypothetical protein